MKDGTSSGNARAQQRVAQQRHSRGTLVDGTVWHSSDNAQHSTVGRRKAGAQQWMAQHSSGIGWQVQQGTAQQSIAFSDFDLS